MVHVRYDEVVVLSVYLYAEAAECVGYNAEVAQRHVLYAYAVAHHGCHAYERAHFNHVGQYLVLGSVQRVYATIVSRFDAMPLMRAPIWLSMWHSCCM